MSFDAHVPQAGTGINPHGQKSKNVIDSVSSAVYQNDKDFVGKGANFSTSIANIKAAQSSGASQA